MFGNYPHPAVSFDALCVKNCFLELPPFVQCSLIGKELPNPHREALFNAGTVEDVF